MTEALNDRNRCFKLWLLGGLLLALPLVSYPLAVVPREVFGDLVVRRFDVRLPWARIGLLAALGYLIWQLARSEGKALVLRPPLGWRIALGLCGVTAALALVLSPHVRVGIGAFVDWVSALSLALLATMWGQRADLRKLVVCCVVAVLLVSAYALFQLSVLATTAALEASQGVRLMAAVWKGLTASGVVATLGNRNLLADYLIFSVPLVVCWGFWEPLASGWLRRRLTAAVVLAAILLVLYFCRSRAAWAALGFTAAVGAAGWLALRSQRRAVWVWAGFLAVVLAVAAVAWTPLRSAFAEDVRWEIWRGTWRLIQKQPITGTGPGAFFIEYPQFRTPEYFEKPKAAPFTDHAHNEWLEIWAETGVFGLLAFAWALAYAASRWWRWRGQMQPRNWAFALAATALVVHGTFEVSLRFPAGQTLLWLALGLSLSGLPLPVLEWCVPQRGRTVLTAAVGVVGCCTFFFFVWQPLAADTHWRRANIARESGNNIVALNELETTIRIQRHRVDALYQLAGLLEQMAAVVDAHEKERFERRLGEVLINIHELAPDYRAANFKWGLWLCRSGNIKEGIPFLERQVELEVGTPTKPEIAAAFALHRYWLACAYLDTGRRAEARRMLMEAQRLDPKNEEVAKLLRRHFSQSSLKIP